MVVYMPDEAGVEYPHTVFLRLQNVRCRGGFSTWDLG